RTGRADRAGTGATGRCIGPAPQSGRAGWKAGHPGRAAGPPPGARHGRASSPETLPDATVTALRSPGGGDDPAGDGDRRPPAVRRPAAPAAGWAVAARCAVFVDVGLRSEEHTSELQSREQ